MSNKIITKTNARKKVIDFRDKLILASADDIRNMHGTGGKDHAPNSTIGVYICDYQNGTGAQSSTVSYNLPIQAIYQLHAVAERYLLYPTTAGIAPESLDGIISSIKLLCEHGSANLSELNGIGKKVWALKQSAAPNDYEYRAAKPDIYNATGNAAPISMITIRRQEMRNGKKAMMPWYIEIANGTAPFSKCDDGRINYSGRDMKITAKASINISDDDFYRMMCRITAYISVWENANVIPVLRKVQEAEKKEAQARWLENNVQVG